MIESFDVVFYTAIFILPGFFICRIIDIVNPVHKEEYGIYILRCLFFSILNCACSSFVFNLILKLKETKVMLYWICLLGSELAISTLIALFISIFKQKQLFQKVLRRAGLNPSFNIPTAWDYALSKAELSFVVVTLIDGSQIFGLYAGNSYSSSASDDRDLFLEKVYSFEDKEWRLVPHSKGILISNNQIRTIEFMEANNE